MSVNTPEFEEIGIGGGKLEFRRDGNGQVSIGITTTSIHFRALYQIAVSYQGKPLAVVPFTGVGTPTPPYPKPSLLAWIRSDAQGLWGRRCPFCKCYFRTEHVGGGLTVCPYCCEAEDSLRFMTEAQEQYVAAFCNALVRAHNGPDDVVIELESITDAQSEWNYSEQKQQFHFTCSKCKTETDILGQYGWCPECGTTNAEQVINSKLTATEKSFAALDSTETDREKRAKEWETINSSSFSDFEALANHLKTRLALIPATPKRRDAVRALNFQRLTEATKALQEWFAIDIFDGLSTAECEFMNLMLHRRHICIHNGGRADGRYLSLSGDIKAKLNQRVRIDSGEVRRIVPLIRRVCVNLVEQFESINM
jgi:hypothetical protein